MAALHLHAAPTAVLDGVCSCFARVVLVRYEKYQARTYRSRIGLSYSTLSAECAGRYD